MRGLVQRVARTRRHRGRKNRFRKALAYDVVIVTPETVGDEFVAAVAARTPRPRPSAAVNTRDQLRFNRFRFDESRLNLHRHRDQDAKRLIVFVHGLNGGGYHTWGNFPRFVFDDPARDPVDVALFDYCSGLRRRIGKRPPVPVIAHVLTERLQDLSGDYDEIFIIAHSMGGLISADALRNYVTQRNEEPGLLRVLAGMIDISTPWNGSKFATARIRLLISEWELLQEDSTYQRDIRNYLSTKVDSTNTTRIARGAHKLPIWAFVGGRDRIVERSSATLGIDERQIRTVDNGHRKIAKPRRLGGQVVNQARNIIDGITLLRVRIRDEEEIARKAMRPQAPADLVLVEILLEADANDDWQPIYESVVQSSGSPRVRVQDRLTSGAAYPANLLISAHRSADLIARREMTRLKLRELRRRYDAGGAHARAISVGPMSQCRPSKDALAEMTGVLHQDNQQFMLKFRFAEDEEFRQRLSQAVAEIVNRQQLIVSQRDAYPVAGQPVQILIDPEELA
jgi:pimeloyl-ACP methyl ester carboxylesterase